MSEWLCFKSLEGWIRNSTSIKQILALTKHVLSICFCSIWYLSFFQLSFTTGSLSFCNFVTILLFAVQRYCWIGSLTDCIWFFNFQFCLKTIYLTFIFLFLADQKAFSFTGSTRLTWNLTFTVAHLSAIFIFVNIIFVFAKPHSYHST